MKIKSITNNTDTVDIDNNCLGMHVGIGCVTPMHKARGLHIQIKHNQDKATYETAVEATKLIASSPEMLEALEFAHRVLYSRQGQDDGLDELFRKVHLIMGRFK